MNLFNSNLQIDTSATTEKFQHMRDELLLFLLANLKKLCLLEKEFATINEQLELKKKNLGIPDSQVAPGCKEMWSEYHRQYVELLKSICSDSLIKSSSTPSISTPAEYEYLNICSTKVFFIMKSSNRAVVETSYKWGVEKKHQFVLKKVGDEWKITEKNYAFGTNDTWHKDRL